MSHTWNKHPIPSAVTRRNRTLRALYHDRVVRVGLHQYVAPKIMENCERNTYVDEVSSNCVVSPHPSTIIVHPNQMTSLYRAILVTIAPEMAPTRAAPREKGSILTGEFMKMRSEVVGGGGGLIGDAPYTSRSRCIPRVISKMYGAEMSVE